jgi:hypothetical protein
MTDHRLAGDEQGNDTMQDVIVAQYGGIIFIGNAEDAIRALNEDKEFHLVVFCAKELGPPPLVFHPTKPLLKRRTRVYHAPLDDAELTRDELFIALRAANLVAATFLARKRVLVTCMEGRNRSALVTALALDMLSSEGGLAAREAVRQRRVRAKGPVLSNPSFAKVLENIPPRLGGPRAIVLGTSLRPGLVL